MGYGQMDARGYVDARQAREDAESARVREDAIARGAAVREVYRAAWREGITPIQPFEDGRAIRRRDPFETLRDV